MERGWVNVSIYFMIKSIAVGIGLRRVNESGFQNLMGDNVQSV